MTPAIKLKHPRQSIKMRKPVGPSERCGVSTAEKILGSAEVSLGRPAALLSLLMRLIIQK